jgi:hypothetical protein
MLNPSQNPGHQNRIGKPEPEIGTADPFCASRLPLNPLLCTSTATLRHYIPQNFLVASSYFIVFTGKTEKYAACSQPQESDEIKPK